MADGKQDPTYEGAKPDPDYRGEEESFDKATEHFDEAQERIDQAEERLEKNLSDQESHDLSKGN